MKKLAFLLSFSFCLSTYAECQISIAIDGNSADRKTLSTQIKDQLSRRLYQLEVFNLQRGADYTVRIKQHGFFIVDGSYAASSVIELVDRDNRIVGEAEQFRYVSENASRRVKGNALYSVTKTTLANLFRRLPACPDFIPHF